jgi:hypothetical protein
VPPFSLRNFELRRLIGAKLPRPHIELLLKSLNLFLGHPSAKEKMLKSVSAIFFHLISLNTHCDSKLSRNITNI